jgi:serine/threonine protein kinase
MKLLVCSENTENKESIREYDDSDFDVEIIGSCDLVSIKDKLSRFGEVYIPTIDLYESFADILKRCNIKFHEGEDHYSLKAVLDTMNLISKVLDIDMKLTWNSELNKSFFVLRDSERSKASEETETKTDRLPGKDFFDRAKGTSLEEKLRQSESNTSKSQKNKQTIDFNMDTPEDDEWIGELEERLETVKPVTIKHADKEYKISKKCLKGYKIKEYISSGTYGSVHKACLEDNCDYVIKIMSTDDLPSKIEEGERTKEMSNLEIGPKYYGSWTCLDDNVFIIVTEKWDDELKVNDIQNLDKEIIDKYEELVKKLNNSGYIHMDLLPKNILVQRYKDLTVIDITLTDFGIMVTKDKINTLDPAWINTMYEYYMGYTSTAEYFEDKNITLEDVIKNPIHFDKALLYYMRKHSN